MKTKKKGKFRWYIEWDDRTRMWCVVFDGFYAYRDESKYLAEQEMKRIIKWEDEDE